MDVRLINPFLKSFNTVMPKLGFTVCEKSVTVKDGIKADGVTVSVGVIGDVKGNVIYILSEDSAKKVASKMMMDMPLDELNDMAKSALSELSNMLTANACINYSDIGLNTDISTPVLVTGKDMTIKVNTKKIICIELLANEVPIEMNISLE